MITATSLPAQEAAKLLWISAYWCDDRHRAFADLTGRSPVAAFGQQMEYWPTPAVPHGYVEDVADMLARTEQAWGRTLDDVADEMGEEVDHLAYLVAMQTIGHGIGPDDDGTFPEGLDPSPLYIEDPAYHYLPEPGDWSGIDAEDLA